VVSTSTRLLFSRRPSTRPTRQDSSARTLAARDTTMTYTSTEALG
jgi:hypothetical protein